MVFRKRRRETENAFALYYASDVHGSDRCWRKFLGAGRFYEVDALLMGGDLTGKAVVPIAAFWALDAYFLRAERLFRALYDEVRLKDSRVEPFYMGATGRRFVRRIRRRETACDNKKAASHLRAATSLTLLLIYLGLLVATAVIAASTYRTNHPHKAKPPHPPAQASRMRSAIPSKRASSS